MENEENSFVLPQIDALFPIYLGEEQMADPVVQADLFNLYRDHADIRQEATANAGNSRYDVSQAANETIKESLKGDWNVERAVKDARHDNIVATDAVGDRMTTQIDKQMNRIEARDFDTMRDLAGLRSTIDVGQTMIMGGVAAASAASARETEIAVLKNTIEAQKNTQYLGDKIGFEGEKTRELINELKYGDLNRHLIERNSELVDERFGRRHWRDLAGQNQFQGQWAALQSQVQAFGSQLQETRQGMVNLGTMTGVGQTSTSNNI